MQWNVDKSVSVNELWPRCAVSCVVQRLWVLWPSSVLSVMSFCQVFSCCWNGQSVRLTLSVDYLQLFSWNWLTPLSYSPAVGNHNTCVVYCCMQRYQSYWCDQIRRQHYDGI